MDDALTYKEQKFMRTMKDMKKVLTVVMALAVAFAGVVMLFADDNSAAEAGGAKSKYDPDVNGVLDFDFKSTSGVDNYKLNNQIQVVYDKDSETYIVTGTIAKQETTGGGGFATLWGDANYPYGIAFKATLTNEETVQVGEGTPGSDGECLLFIKEPTQKNVEIGSDVYIIDFRNVVLCQNEEDNPDYGYVVIPNANAITNNASEGVDCNGGTWSLSNKRLTLTDYDGVEYFNADFDEVILVGENKITLSGVGNALKSTEGFVIKSVDGVGSLDIVMDEITHAEAIYGEENVEINGVNVSISVTEGEEASKSGIGNAVAIHAQNFSIYDATLTIDVAETDYENAVGINSNGTVDIKSATVQINAGSSGIVAKDVIIAASDVNVDADQFGIKINFDGDSKGISITNKSNVEVEVFGLAEGYYQPYGIYTKDLDVQSDSILRTKGMYVSGSAVNNATVINDGDMVIVDDATFNNVGVFENNGILGIYGSFENSSGQTVNNGQMSNYAQKKGETFNPSIKVEYDGKTLEVKLCDGKAELLADGEFFIELQVKCSLDEAEENNTDPQGAKYYGTIEYTSNGKTGDSWGVTGYSINVINDQGEILTIVYNGSVDPEYEVYSEKDTFYYRGDEISGLDGFLTGITENSSSMAVTGGSFSNEGTVSIGAACSEFLTKGEFINNGTFEINAGMVVSGGKLSGNNAAVGAGVTLALSGEINMIFSHGGSYTTTTASSSTPVVTQFTDVIEVVGKTRSVEITTPGTNDNSRKGLLAISGMNAEDKETATITLLQGSASIAGSVETGMEVRVASGATLQIDKAEGVEATAGVISVQDGAELNMKVSSDRNTYSYGELKYKISFQNEGYTYYGSIQFALANAAEGATLKLDSNAEINTDTAVKAGITLVFADKAELTISGTNDKKITVSMGDGAKFVLEGNSKLTVNENVTFSGTVVYDVNEMIFEKVEFMDSADITGVKASTTTESSLNVGMNADDGIITISKGLSTGKLGITEKMQTSDSGKLNTTSKLIISEGATFKATSTDGFVDSENADTEINGTLNLEAELVVEGKVQGTGSIVIKDGVSVTFAKTATVGLTLTNGADGFVFDGVSGKEYMADGTVDRNESKPFVVSSVAKTATKAAYLTISGTILEGTVTSEGNTVLGNGTDGFVIGTGATVVIPTNATLTVAKFTEGNEVCANGLLKVAGKLNMFIENDSTTVEFGALTYQITYTDGEYTVYTMLSTGVSNATAGDSFEVNRNLDVKENMEIPAGVTLIIGENVRITVESGKYISIGTPIKSVGATSSIQGKIYLSGNSFVIVYTDNNVDMSKAKIVTGEPEKVAKNSQYSILNEIYATVHGGDGTVSEDSHSRATNYNDVKDVLTPEIDGYRFLGWKPLVDVEPDDIGSIAIGETDFEANMKASMVKVTFTKVDGISYYVDNEKQNLVGAPVYVAYGSTVTAVADYGYTGNALVNGKAYIVVDTDTTTITGSGVSVSEPGVIVEPAKDGSIGITEYLLIVLVILAAILVVVVAIRMMRS